MDPSLPSGEASTRPGQLQRYTDEHGREHREKVGPKDLAIKVYAKRKTPIQERRFFPERFKQRDRPLVALIAD